MKSTTTIISLLSAVLCVSMYADNNQTQPQDFGSKVDQKIGAKYNAQSEQIRMLADKLNELEKKGVSAPQAQTYNKADFDAKTLPIVQGTYVIKKDGKTVKSGALVSDGGADMYLTNKNNKAVKEIAQDHVTYKVGSTSTTSPIILNKTTQKTDGFKPEINEFSSVQTPVSQPKQLPTYDEMLKLTKPQQ